MLLECLTHWTNPSLDCSMVYLVGSSWHLDVVPCAFYHVYCIHDLSHSIGNLLFAPVVVLNSYCKNTKPCVVLPLPTSMISIVLKITNTKLMCVVSSSLACVTQRDGIPEIPNVWFINFQAFPKFLTSRISHQRSLQIDYVYIVNHFSHCWCVYTHLMTGKKKNTASITLFWQKHQQALFPFCLHFARSRQTTY